MTGTNDFKATEADETTSDLNGQSKYDIDKIERIRIKINLLKPMQQLKLWPMGSAKEKLYKKGHRR